MQVHKIYQRRLLCMSWDLWLCCGLIILMEPRKIYPQLSGSLRRSSRDVTLGTSHRLLEQWLHWDRLSLRNMCVDASPFCPLPFRLTMHTLIHGTYERLPGLQLMSTRLRAQLVVWHSTEQLHREHSGQEKSGNLRSILWFLPFKYDKCRCWMCWSYTLYKKDTCY